MALEHLQERMIGLLIGVLEHELQIADGLMVVNAEGEPDATHGDSSQDDADAAAMATGARCTGESQLPRGYRPAAGA
jgi:hypothetical protein